MDLYVSPIDPSTAPTVEPAPRLATLTGAVIGLLDISKPRSAEFLDRLEVLLRERYEVGDILRLRKPTFARPAPGDVLSEAQRCGAVVEALAD